MQKNPYQITAQDVAMFLIQHNLSHSQETVLIRRTFHSLSDYSNLSPEELPIYRKELRIFSDTVRNSAILYELNPDEYKETTLILHDFGIEPPQEQNEDYLISYFKNIKLRLFSYQVLNCHRCKFRTLLAQLGYRRRSQSLIKNMNRAVSALGLQVFLKNGIPCDLAKINLDKWITIRLKNQ